MRPKRNIPLVVGSHKDMPNIWNEDRVRHDSSNEITDQESKLDEASINFDEQDMDWTDGVFGG
jgi:hypothetical protein